MRPRNGPPRSPVCSPRRSAPRPAGRWPRRPGRRSPGRAGPRYPTEAWPGPHPNRHPPATSDSTAPTETHPTSGARENTRPRNRSPPWPEPAPWSDRPTRPWFRAAEAAGQMPSVRPRRPDPEPAFWPARRRARAPRQYPAGPVRAYWHTDRGTRCGIARSSGSVRARGEVWPVYGKSRERQRSIHACVPPHSVASPRSVPTPRTFVRRG